MLAVILLLIAALTAVKGDDCVQRDVGLNKIVCVCNSTYCDSAPNVQVHEHQYVQYISTRNGKRLQSSVANWSNEIMPFSTVLTVDKSIKYQKILGFGGAMTDAAALNIMTLSNETQDKLIESYYSNEGSRYTLCRIPIAGTDFSTRPYTYDDTSGDVTLSNFSLVEEDDYKIYYLHKLKNVMSKPDDLKIFTTAWSAPPWMKISNDIKWGSLKREYYQLYADYIRKFFDAYKKRGVNIWGMTPGNEPINGLFPFFSFNAMLWLPTREAEFSTDYLEPTLHKAGYDNLVYMAMDDQRFEIPSYSDFVFKNKKANKIFKGTAFHWYADRLFSPERLDKLQEEYPDKFLLMTEACTGSNPLEKNKVILGSWERGEQYLSNIIENLSHWSVGWVDWNLALNQSGGPNWANNFVDSPIIVMPENDEFYKQPMYYALSHVSRYVPRNSVRISSTGLEYNDDVKAIAFYTPEKKIVVVMINKADMPYNVTIKLEDKDEDKDEDKVTPTLGPTIYIELPERSFITVETAYA